LRSHKKYKTLLEKKKEEESEKVEKREIFFREEKGNFLRHSSVERYKKRPV